MNTAPLFLAGPTAVGKSAVALLLAERLGGEIISVDSMQVYRGLDIGTAKPTPAERARVPHHLIDVVELSEPFDAARFVRLAQAAVADIQARGCVPIFCGGTGLYFRAYLEGGLGTAPPADAALRAQLNATPLADQLRELAQRDPETFARIDQKNPRRIVRALEVIRLTGQPFSTQRAEWTQASRRSNVEDGRPPSLGAQVSSLRVSSTDQHAGWTPALHFICLNRPPEDLRRRIDARVDEMFARGLVVETRELLTRGLAENPTAMQAIGYRQVVEHLRGERGLAETIELVKIRTRQFAKRQLTWFRRQPTVDWVELTEQASSVTVIDRLFASR